MGKARKGYRSARRLMACRLPILLLSWVLTVGLILIGIGQIDRFSLYMALSLILGFGGTFLYLAAALCFGNKASALAREIVDLNIPVEEMLALAAQYSLDPEYIHFYFPDAER